MVMRTNKALTRSLRALLPTLLMGAAGLSAFAQAPEAPASAPSAPMAASASAPAPQVRRVSPPRPTTSALAPVPTWSQLTPAQRELLTPLSTDWDELSAEQRTKWLNATPLLAGLPASDLERVHERMRGWSRLTPAERLNARIAFQSTRQMLDDERRRAKWEAYQALPPEKRQELAEKAAARRKAQAAAALDKKHLASGAKSNIVPAAPKLLTPVPAAGGLIQARPGATTVLINRTDRRPLHQIAGQSKVVADPELVDPKTLLPKSLKAALPASAPRP